MQHTKENEKFPDWMKEFRGRGKMYNEYLHEQYAPWKVRNMKSAANGTRSK